MYYSCCCPCHCCFCCSCRSSCYHRLRCPCSSRCRPHPATPAAADVDNTAAAAAVGIVIVAAAVVFTAAVIVAAAIVLICACSHYLVMLVWLSFVLIWVCLRSFGFHSHSFGLVCTRPCSFMPHVVSVSNIRSVYTK